MNKMFQAAAVVLCFCPLISASTLLYNGDAGGPSGVFGVPGPLAALGNTATQTGNGSVLFDDFVVPAGGWDITGVFSNNQVPNLLPYTATGGLWEIWSDLDGPGQTLVASGSTSTDFSWTPTGRFDNYIVFPEYTLSISDLNVELAPGTYWLAVAPFISDSGIAEISATDGRNSVGMPLGSNGAPFTGTPQGTDLFPTSAYGAFDFSMGIDGVATPGRGTLPLSALVLAFCLYRRRSANRP